MNEPEPRDVGLTIDADIRIARTLPARVYADPSVFRAQQRRVFARTWRYAAHDDVVKVAGQVYPFTSLPGSLDEPLLLTRDAQDRVSALSNVCTHRGTLVVEGPGHEQRGALAALRPWPVLAHARGRRAPLPSAARRVHESVTTVAFRDSDRYAPSGPTLF